MTSQIYPKTTFTYSLEDESLRLLYVLNRLTTQEFRTRGFFFLPDLPKLAKDRAVVIPKLPYSTIPDLWERVSSLTADTPMVGPRDLVESIKFLISPSYEDQKYEVVSKRIQSKWSMVYRDFFDALYKIIPQYQNVISEINVILTECGTSCTFSLVDSQLPKLTIYLRLDQGVAALAEAIVTALIRPKLQFSLGYTWEEIESVVDFLLRDTTLNQVIPDTNAGTIAHLRRSQLGNLQDQSESYIRSLMTTDFTLWRKHGASLSYGGQTLIGLTKKQQILLELMLAKRGQTVTYDELANAIGQDSNNFSLWAIVKEVSRLRQALAAQGLPPGIIHAHRKVGYSLV